jgi:hypothetical protein
MRAGDQTGPDVVALANGGFAAAWVDSQAGAASVEARVFTAPGATSTAVQGGSQTSNAGSGASDPAPAASTPVVSSPIVSSPIVSTPGTPVASTPSTPVASSPSVPASASVAGTAGKDVLAASQWGGVLDGKEGIDTAVFGNPRAWYVVQDEGANMAVYNIMNSSATRLANVERLQFSDQTVALDINGNAGESYRLYQAAFNRTPDKVGLGYWINSMDQGHSLMEVAASFINSAEFAEKYGANPSDAQYVEALYQNVLHRAPDATGYDFWLHALQIAPRAEVLVNFSESPENQAQVIGAIANGIGYTPWLG